MNLSRATLSLLLGMVVAIPGARALTVFDYSAISHERFSSGFPSSPVANASFFLSGYDLSGIGWTSGSFGVTLISPRHFVTAAHVSPGASVSFFSTDGVLRNYAVESTHTILHTAGVATDLLVGRLADPIPGEHNVNHYSTLLLGSAGEYVGMTIAAFGSGQRAGTNTIDDIGLIDMLPFGSPNSVDDNVVFLADYDAFSGQTQGQSGDSGSPSFVAIGGSLALLGTHSAIDTVSSPTRTIDVFVPSYYTAINDRLALDGYSFGAFVAVPEPSTWAVLVGLLVLAVACLRRRSRRP